jgi:hypothetical protein
MDILRRPPNNGYIFNANIRGRRTKTLSASKEKNKYSLVKWGCILYVVNVLVCFINITI